MTQFQSNVPEPRGNTGGDFEIGSFDFHGDPVVVLMDGSGSWAVLGQLCRNLELDSRSQQRSLEEKSWSQGRTVVRTFQLPGDTQSRQHFLIHERVVPMWLANLTASRIQDTAKRDKIEWAQTELADALYEYVTNRRPTREPSKLEVARDLVAALEAKEALEAENKVLAPKAGKWDEFLSAEGLIGMRETADLFHVDVKVLTAWLVEINVFRRQVSRNGGARNLPRKAHQDSGRFVVKMETKNGFRFPVAYVTGDGLDFIDDRWKKRSAA